MQGEGVHVDRVRVCRVRGACGQGEGVQVCRERVCRVWGMTSTTFLTNQ